MFISEISKGEAAASHLNLYGKKCTVTWSSALNPAFGRAGANALLYYNEFLDLKSKNFKYMNVMAANIPDLLILSLTFLLSLYLITL